MAFSSIDDLVNSITSGKSFRYDLNKITGGSNFTAGRWYDFSSLNGSPVGNAWAGSALTWRPCDEATGNGTQSFGMPHGGDVSPDTKHLLNAAICTSAGTGVPSQLMLVDLQGYYPGISMSTNSVQNLSGSPTLRYANGEGIRAFLVITSTSGGSAHNLSMSYTNSAGTSGRTLPVTVSCTASAIVTHITHSGPSANNYGPFLPLNDGDSGMRSVQSVTLSASSGSGVAALCLAKPIMTLPLTNAYISTERDFVNQIPSLPEIKPGACLVWLYFAGANTVSSSSFYGHIELGWS